MTPSARQPAPTPPIGLRERKKVATRLAIAHAALALFEERGYDATTVDDIAAAANVSRRTFFRYFAGKDEVFIVDPEGKLRALHVALADGPPDEPTIDALRRGILALAATYFDPELVRTEARIAHREPAIAAAGLAYQVRWEDALAQEVADDLRVDVNLDPRPRIVAHAAVAILRAGAASWLAGSGRGEPADEVARTFDLTVPALEAVLAMPVGSRTTKRPRAATRSRSLPAAGGPGRTGRARA
jgi:AcrR family transcriptional regulator